MFRKGLLVGFSLLLTSLSVNANEISIQLSQGKPTQQEFVLAAKRALFSRNYEIWSVDPEVVIGKYRGRVEMALILTDDAVILRNTDNGGVKSETIIKYLKNLRRDFIYELAEYTLVPVAKSDPAKVRALVESTRAADTAKVVSSSNFVINGRYQSRVTSSNQWVFDKESERNLVITFKQNGTEITGINGSANLKISGTIEGDVIRFFTWPSKITSEEVKGTWKISPDSRRLSGKWIHPHGGGEWNLTKID